MVKYVQDHGECHERTGISPIIRLGRVRMKESRSYQLALIAPRVNNSPSSP